MKRPAALVITVVVLAGCRAPMPHLDPWAAYGPRRIPPPSTGSIGQPANTQPYYQSPVQPSSGLQSLGTGVSSSGQLISPTQPSDAVPRTQPRSETASLLFASSSVNAPADAATAKPSGGWKSPASAQEPSPGDGIRIVEPADTSSEVAVGVRPMHVNDATARAEPRRLQVPDRLTEITDLPGGKRASTAGPSAPQPSTTNLIPDRGTNSSTSLRAEGQWRAAVVPTYSTPPAKAITALPMR